jgi:hypothetical protein
VKFAIACALFGALRAVARGITGARDPWLATVSCIAACAR